MYARESQELNSFLCPITYERMIDPVIASDGHSYERLAIEEWFKFSSTSPRTNLILEDKRLVPNRDLKGAIEEYYGTYSGALIKEEQLILGERSVSPIKSHTEADCLDELIFTVRNDLDQSWLDEQEHLWRAAEANETNDPEIQDHSSSIRRRALQAEARAQFRAGNRDANVVREVWVSGKEVPTKLLSEAIQKNNFPLVKLAIYKGSRAFRFTDVEICLRDSNECAELVVFLLQHLKLSESEWQSFCLPIAKHADKTVMKAFLSIVCLEDSVIKNSATEALFKNNTDTFSLLFALKDSWGTEALLEFADIAALRHNLVILRTVLACFDRTQPDFVSHAKITWEKVLRHNIGLNALLVLHMLEIELPAANVALSAQQLQSVITSELLGLTILRKLIMVDSQMPEDVFRLLIDFFSGEMRSIKDNISKINSYIQDLSGGDFLSDDDSGCISLPCCFLPLALILGIVLFALDKNQTVATICTILGSLGLVYTIWKCFSNSISNVFEIIELHQQCRLFQKELKALEREGCLTINALAAKNLHPAEEDLTLAQTQQLPEKLLIALQRASSGTTLESVTGQAINELLNRFGYRERTNISQSLPQKEDIELGLMAPLDSGPVF